MAEQPGRGWWPKQGGESDRQPESDADAGQDGGDQGPPRPPRGLESRDRPRVASRYSLYVGLAFTALAIIAVVNAIRTDEGGILGADGQGSRGLPLPEFAAPNVLSGLGGDANIAQDDCEGARNPCLAEQQRTPACRVDIEGAIRVCDLFDKPLAISFWFTRGGNCIPTQDSVNSVAEARGGEVNFLSVNVLDDRDRVAEIVRERGWELPVAHDADGAVSNIYAVGVCPTILLAYPGGLLYRAAIAPPNLDQGEVGALIDELVEASAARERKLGA